MSKTTPTITCSPGRRVAYWPGLDWARGLALLLVVLQHALSVLGYLEWSWVGRINLGQLGVGLFLALSGWLAAGDQRPPLEWLRRRLIRVYPSFWVALTGCFLVNWWVAYKPVDAWQVFAQLLGVGLFTHPGQLVNVATWFISLLLLCYALGFFCRLTGRPTLTALVTVLALGTLIALGVERFLCGHMASFFVAFALASCHRVERPVVVAVVGGMTAMLALWLPALWYTVLALELLALALGVPTRAQAIEWVARYSYEFYLVHGIFFVGAMRSLPGPALLRLVLGSAVAALAAWGLHHLTAWVVEWCRQLQRPISAPEPVIYSNRLAIGDAVSLDLSSDGACGFPPLSPVGRGEKDSLQLASLVQPVNKRLKPGRQPGTGDMQ